MYGFPKSKTQRPANFKGAIRGALLNEMRATAAGDGEVLCVSTLDPAELSARANDLCAETDRLLGIQPHERAFLNYQASARKVVEALNRMDRRSSRR